VTVSRTGGYLDGPSLGIANGRAIRCFAIARTSAASEARNLRNCRTFQGKPTLCAGASPWPRAYLLTITAKKANMSVLFTPFKLKDVTLRNRIAVPPMCQYVAVEGRINDWHLAHYTGLARGGAGLVIVEATAVAAEGRITPGCAGLWSDAHAEGMARIAAAIKSAGAVPGIQIAHAGRKASANRPWEGDDHFAEGDPRGWDTLAPSPIAFGANLPKIPKEMTPADIARVTADFATAARRARDAGFQWLELHFAHGYLAQSFFSVHSNKRTDQYGGNAVGRGRFLLETLAAVRKEWPANLPLTARFGVIEYDGRDEETLAEAIDLTRAFRSGGLDMLNVSVGFSTPDTDIPWAPAMLGPIAGRVRREADIPVASAWGIDAPALVERTVAEGQLDIVMVGRAHLADPHWPYRAALELRIERPSWVLPAPYAHWLERYHAAQ
jgi:2,4-dienoyl-CoA reductase-like NADH-dependent reductase (Old Yellow Enzyme family)